MKIVQEHGKALTPFPIYCNEIHAEDFTIGSHFFTFVQEQVCHHPSEVFNLFQEI